MLTDTQVQELGDGLEATKAKTTVETLRQFLRPWARDRKFALSADSATTSQRSRQDVEAEEGLDDLAEAFASYSGDIAERFAGLVKSDVRQLTEKVRSKFEALARIDADVRMENTQLALQQLIYLRDQLTDNQLQRLASTLLDKQQMRLLNIDGEHLRAELERLADSISFDYPKSINPILRIRLRQMATETAIEASKIDVFTNAILYPEGAQGETVRTFTDAQVAIALRIRREQWGNMFHWLDGESLSHQLRQLSALRDRIHHEQTVSRLWQLITVSNGAVFDYLRRLDQLDELTSDNLAGIDVCRAMIEQSLDESLCKRLWFWSNRKLWWLRSTEASSNHDETRESLFAELKEIYRELGEKQARATTQLRNPVDQVDGEERVEHFKRWATFDEALTDSAFRGRIDQLIAQWTDSRATDELRELAVFGARQIAVGRQKRLDILYTFDVKELNAALQPQRARLIAEGQSTTSEFAPLTRLAGTILPADPATVNAIQPLVPELAHRISTEGIPVNLRGLIDLTAYAAHFRGGPCQPVLLGEIGPNYAQSNPVTRSWLWYNDNRRATAAFCVRYARHDNHGKLTVPDDVHHFLNENPLRYTGDGRSKLPMPGVLLAELAKVNFSLAHVDGTISDEQADQSPANAVPKRLGEDRPPVSLTVDQPEPMPRIGEPIHYAAVFGDLPIMSGTPSPAQVRQGATGDCVLIAALRAVARNRPGDLENAIRDNGDGTLTVWLHEASRVGDRATPTGTMLEFTVTASVPHDARGMVLYAQPHGALWGAILEKTMAGRDQLWTLDQHLASSDKWTRRYHSQARPGDPIHADPTGYHHIGNGSYSWDGAVYLTQLTGVTAVMRKFPKGLFATERLKKRLNNLLRNNSAILLACISKAALLRAGLMGKAEELSLVTAHMYEVVGMEDNHVLLGNPHGHNDPKPIELKDLRSLFDSTYLHLELPVRGADAGSTPPQSNSSVAGIPRLESLDMAGGPSKTAMGIPGTTFTAAFTNDVAPGRVLATAITLLDSLSNARGEVDRKLVLDAASVAAVETLSDGRYQITTAGDHVFDPGFHRGSSWLLKSRQS